jgi:hypothetical protein
MHLSFDYDKNKQNPQCNWPQYFKDFANQDFDPNAPFESRYQIYAQRNYKYVTENGQRYPIPQVRPEGSLKLSREANLNLGDFKHLTLSVKHIREWAIWTESPKSSKQIIDASIQYSNDAFGTINTWDYHYKTNALLPHRFYRFHSLPSVERKGRVKGKAITLTDLNDKVTVSYKTDYETTTLYTLIERIQSNRLTPSKSINLLDDLTMMRNRLSIIPLKKQTLDTENGQFKLTGFALAGLSSLPLYFWKDAASRVIAILGHNVAYILQDVKNI